MTPHIHAAKGDFAPVVIMPGDPLRAKFIADHFLKDVQQVTNVRNMLGFTGVYKEQRISVMGSGMGIPSMSIYSRELFVDYGVEKIIRAGSCGSIHPDINVGDVIIGMGACTDSKVNRSRFHGYDFAAIADYGLLRHAVDTAKELNISTRIGNVMTSDHFYNPNPSEFDVIENMGILGVEMEAAGLYGVAAECHRKALAIFTVSDHIRTGASLSSEERQTSFSAMMKLVLETSIKVFDS